MSAIAFRICALSLVCTLGIARSSSADPVVIYSNFGAPPGYLTPTPDDPFTRPTQGWVSAEDGGYFMGFQLTEAAVLTSVTVPMAWIGAQPVEFGATVFSSSGGALGAPIERLLVPFPADVPPRTFTMLTLSSSIQPTLSADTLYFLSATPTRVAGQFGFGFSSIWPWNNAGIEGVYVHVSGGGGRFVGQGPLGAFQLTGEPNPVPEPGTVLLMATGAGLIARRVRRRGRI